MDYPKFTVSDQKEESTCWKGLMSNKHVDVTRILDLTFCVLTHRNWYFAKQRRTRWDATERSISSGIAKMDLTIPLFGKNNL